MTTLPVLTKMEGDSEGGRRPPLITHIHQALDRMDHPDTFESNACTYLQSNLDQKDYESALIYAGLQAVELHIKSPGVLARQYYAIAEALGKLTYKPNWWSMCAYTLGVEPDTYHWHPPM